MRKQIIILGPTCIGKTAKALELCKKFDGEIVAVDSRQVVKGFDIGTGKTPISNSTPNILKKDGFWEIDGVKVWGYDLVAPDVLFTVTDYATFVKQIPLSKKVVFYVGGTGFYFDILLGRKKTAGVAPDPEFRKKMESLSASQLFELLQEVDMKLASRIDKSNPRRLVRALEISSKPRSLETDLSVFAKEPQIFGFELSREELYKRSDLWVDTIFERGLVEEVKVLIEKGFENSRSMNGLIYSAAKALVKGSLSKEEAVTRTKFDIHAYIRRQSTYFNKISGITWLPVSNTTFDIDLQSRVESIVDE